MEGLKRELVRQINNLRKKAELTIQDRIKLSIKTDNEEIKQVIEKFGDEILKDTLATEFVDSEEEGIEVKVGGEKVKVVLVK